MNKPKPSIESRSISDRLFHVILRLDKISLGGLITLLLNVVILSINVYVVFFSKQPEAASILKRQEQLIEQISLTLYKIETHQETLVTNTTDFLITESLEEN